MKNLTESIEACEMQLNMKDADTALVIKMQELGIQNLIDEFHVKHEMYPSTDGLGCICAK